VGNQVLAVLAGVTALVVDPTLIGAIASALFILALCTGWAWRAMSFLVKIEKGMDEVKRAKDAQDSELKWLRDSYWWLMSKIGQEPPPPPFPPNQTTEK
jgi:hypothetical protein